MPHAALWVVQLDAREDEVQFISEVSMPHAALWVVQHGKGTRKHHADEVSMPHAALWVVQQAKEIQIVNDHHGFNAARGFVGGAARMNLKCQHATKVSMPHAALWVVQQKVDIDIEGSAKWFQCRTRLCGWCSATSSLNSIEPEERFNAARGFVGGAAISCQGGKRSRKGFNAARGFVGGAA